MTGRHGGEPKKRRAVYLGYVRALELRGALRMASLPTLPRVMLTRKPLPARRRRRAGSAQALKDSGISFGTRSAGIAIPAAVTTPLESTTIDYLLPEKTGNTFIAMSRAARSMQAPPANIARNSVIIAHRSPSADP